MGNNKNRKITFNEAVDTTMYDKDLCAKLLTVRKYDDTEMNLIKHNYQLGRIKHIAKLMAESKEDLILNMIDFVRFDDKLMIINVINEMILEESLHGVDISELRIELDCSNLKAVLIILQDKARGIYDFMRSTVSDKYLMLTEYDYEYYLTRDACEYLDMTRDMMIKIREKNKKIKSNIDEINNYTIINLDDVGELKYDPIEIGKKVLQNLGYSVSTSGFGYNSLEITVNNSENKEVFKKTIGE